MIAYLLSLLFFQLKKKIWASTCLIFTRQFDLECAKLRHHIIQTASLCFRACCGPSMAICGFTLAYCDIRDWVPAALDQCKSNPSWNNKGKKSNVFLFGRMTCHHSLTNLANCIVVWCCTCWGPNFSCKHPSQHIFMRHTVVLTTPLIILTTPMYCCTPAWCCSITIALRSLQADM